MFKRIAIALLLNGFDYVTGFISAVKNKELNSTKLRDGLFKKVGFVLCYCLAYLIDTYGSLLGFELSVHILPAVVLYVSVTETISIIENIAKINPDMNAGKLLEMFHVKH